MPKGIPKAGKRRPGGGRPRAKDPRQIVPLRLSAAEKRALLAKTGEKSIAKAVRKLIGG